ncbi:MAG: menaquinol oxidoreductase [Nitrospinae bacterium RIFCSPLOWO2_12_FULL_45_22]|nr:MAG: menaquinol oxidoreductase [Nitrospinae bacterium RIFCSPLOWO2_12_FULL_45_22]
MSGRMVLIGAGSGALALLFLILFLYLFVFSHQGPLQPIAFSHKTHVGINQIPCLYCHQYARKAAIAGIPSVEKCRNCHIVVLPFHPEVKKLLDYWAKKESIGWIKVTDLPDHVYFNHKRHIRAGIDCAICHGAVEQMDRMYQPLNPEMGKCLECHRQRKVSIDCWTCHK